MRETALAARRANKRMAASPKKYTPNTVFVALAAAAVVTAGVMLFADLEKITVGILTMVLLIELLLIGIQIGIAMIAAAFICLVRVGSYNITESTFMADMFNAVASWQLSVLPMFVLLGIAMWSSGITSKAYSAAQLWLGRLPGGYAVATVSAGAALAASSGSTLGITVGLGKMSLPEMLKAGYSPPLATGSVAMAGTLGQVIPPSVLLVIYAGIAETPIGPQLLAGLVPGVLAAVAFCILIVLWATFRPKAAPKAQVQDMSWRAQLRSVVGVAPLVLVMLIVIGGMLSGIFTATEAAAVGAIAAIVVGFFAGNRDRSFKGFASFVGETTRQTVSSLGSIFLLLIGALLLTTAIARSGLAQAISTWLLGMELGRVELLLLLIVVYLILGMFLESLPMILLTVPLLQLPLEAAGIDMIWFGVFIVLMCEIGMVFPPIGMLTFVVHQLAQDKDTNAGVNVTLVDVFKGIMPFVGAIFVLLIFYIWFPEIILWLPSVTSGG